MSSAPDGRDREAFDEPVVRDKRRIDPQTGQVRLGEPGAGAAPGPAPGPASAAAPASAGAADGGAAGVAEAGQAEAEPGADARVAELTADLQRERASFANFRRRVERDRQAVVDEAYASVLIGLLPVLDDIERARAHGELEGGFKSVADNLETTLTKLGLERFGVAGEPFDPMVHEALTHGFSADVAEPSCAEVLQPGYRFGERVLRPARVAVVEPGDVETTPEVDD